MKSAWPLLLVLAAPCLAHPPRQRGAALLAERRASAGEQQGAARIIHGIRGAERALAKDLRAYPKFLVSEERLLHKASRLALRGGKLHARQLRALKKLNRNERVIKGSLMQRRHSSGSAKFAALARAETRLLQGGRGMLKSMRRVKVEVARAFGRKESAELRRLMDRIDAAQREVLQSEAGAARHASRLAAALRRRAGRRAPVAAGAFAQGRSRAVQGTKDPVRRAKLAKQALGQLAAAKQEVAAAYGSDDETAQKVGAMIDQLQGSMQGLETDSEEDAKTNLPAEEAEMFASIEGGAKQKQAQRRPTAFAQARTRALQGTQDPARRAKLARQALGQLAAAKQEVAAAYGADDETAQKVGAMIDQLQGSMQGLETDSEEDAQTNLPAEEAEMFANIESDAKQKQSLRKPAAFAQASTRAVQGTRDPVRRAKLARQALGQLAAAKQEVAAAYGADDETAQKVGAMIDQLQGSMQGLESDSEEDAKTNLLADIGSDAAKKKIAKVSLGQAAANTETDPFKELEDELAHL